METGQSSKQQFHEEATPIERFMRIDQKKSNNIVPDRRNLER